MDATRIKKIYKNLKYKYRLVIYNESTFETEYSFFLSKLNVILFFCTTLLAGLLLALVLISFTPLKYYLPGMGEVGVQRQLRALTKESDELKRKARENELWAKNIREVLTGNVNSNNLFIESEINSDSIK